MQNNDMANKVKVRESRGELLRLLCMFMIVMHHFAVHCLYPFVLHNTIPSDWCESIVLYGHSLIFIGVNCFVLLSGFYGIQVSVKSFARLYMFLSFYALIDTILGGSGVSTCVKSAILPFSSLLSRTCGNDYWFLRVYVALYLISPILNAAKTSLEKKSYLMVCLLLLVMQVYFGDFKSIIDENRGYSIFNFIFLYMIGGYINKYVEFEKLKKERWKVFVVLMVTCALWGGATYLKVHQCYIHLPKWHPFAYNNIMIIIASITFFMLVMSVEIQNKVINGLAVSCLAVYLIQENHLFDYQSLSQGVCGVNVEEPFVKFSYWVILSMVFFISALLVDKIRILLQYPIELFLRRYEYK